MIDGTHPDGYAAWFTALSDLNRHETERIGGDLLRAHGPLTFADLYLLPALTQIGTDWDRGDRSLAEVYVAGRMAWDLVEEHMPDPSAATPRIGIALLNDYHALGKMIVSLNLRAAGIPVHDFGTVGAVELADRVIELDLEGVLVSTLMLRSALDVAPLVDRLRASGHRARVAVGGAPFRMDPTLWKRLGADAFGPDAAAAVHIARGWLQDQEADA